MFTKQQLEQLEKLMRVVVSDETEKVIDRKLDEKIKYLPTKEEFFDRMDVLSGDLKKNSEEQAVISAALSEQSDRLDVCEERLDILEDKPAKKKLH